MKLENTASTIKETKEVVEKKQSTKKIKELTLEDKITEWKAKYGKIYKNTIDGETIIWRAIRRGEYRELLSSNEELESEARLLAKQDKTTLMAVLYPDTIADLIEQKAGLATVLSEEILAKSGFDITETESL